MSAAKTWFVQTGFGTRLGPMPADALQEMVRTGALVRGDQVREASEEQWQQASEVPGLFAPASNEPATVVTLTAESQPSLADSETSPAHLIPLPLRLRSELGPPPASFPQASTRVASLADVASEAMSAGESPAIVAAAVAPEIGVPATAAPRTAESDLINAWKMERSRSTEDLGMVSLADELTQAQDNDERDAQGMLAAADIASTDSVREDFAPPQLSRAAPQRRAFLDQVPGLEEGPQVTFESSRETWDRLRRSLPGWQVASAVLLVVLSAWWLWPRSQRAIYDRYVSLWSEWKQRRSDVKDQAGWDRFLRHADAELNEIVPWLEMNTPASDNEKKLLLFIGRDCLKKIRMHPRQIGSIQEKQLEMLLTQVHALYEPSAPPAPREAYIGAKSVPLKNKQPQSSAIGGPAGVVPVVQDPAKLKSGGPTAGPESADASAKP